MTAIRKLKMPQQQINGAKSTEIEAKTVTMPSVVSFNFSFAGAVSTSSTFGIVHARIKSARLTH